MSSPTLNLGSLFNSLINTGGSVYGSLLTKDLVDQILGGKVNVLNNLNAIQSGAQGNINALQGPLLNQMSGVSNAGMNNFFNDQSGYGGYLNQGLQGLGQFQQMLDPNSIPGLSQYFGNSGGETGYGSNLAGTALALAQGNAGSLSPLLQSGQSLLSNPTTSPFVQLLQQVASNSLGNGGYTQPLNQVTQAGQSLLQQNPLAAQAGGLASSIFGNGQPVLPMGQAVSLAMNQNATQSQQQENDLRQQLLNRTGVTGPAIASGQQNELLQNLGNQALQNQSNAVTNTILGQQGLGLQQLAQGNNLFSNTTGANLGYTGQGLNAILQAASQAGQLQNILGNLGLGGGSLGLNTAATGGNLLNLFNQGSLGGLSAGNSLLNSLSGINQGLANTSLSSQALGQNQLSNMYGALNSLVGQGNTQGGQALNAMLGGAGFTGNTLQQYMNQLLQGGTSQVGLYSQTPQYPSNFMQNLTSGGGGSLFGLSLPNISLGGGTSPQFDFNSLLSGDYNPFGIGSSDPFGGFGYGFGQGGGGYSGVGGGVFGDPARGGGIDWSQYGF